MQFDFQQHPVFSHFYAINQVPRCSNQEEKISAFLYQFAENKGWDVKKDALGNLCIDLPATPGCEDAPRVLVQGHMDMVCIQEKGVSHDFSTDPIEMYESQGWLHARGTTLGADDGIGVAMGLALLEEDIPHPALRILVTIAEETGMDGAMGLSEDWLDGEVLINIDSEEEGFVTVGCAGGATGILHFPMKERRCSNPPTLSCTISGFRGGHSGMEISQVHTSALKSIVQYVRRVKESHDYAVSYLQSGTKHNAIPSEATVYFQVPREEKEEAQTFLLQLGESMLSSMIKQEPDGRFEVKEEKERPSCYEEESLVLLLNALDLLPHGVYTMEENGDVQASDNLAIVETQAGEAYVELSVRSSHPQRQQELQEQILETAARFGGEGTFKDGYPAWTYRAHSPLRDLFCAIYEEQQHKPCQVLVIHAGLECSLFAQKNPRLDLISFGPDILGAHTPQERLSIESTLRSYELLKTLIQRLSKMKRADVRLG